MMFDVTATLWPDPTVVELTVDNQTPATADHPPLFTLCVRNVSEETLEVSGGQSLPLWRFSAHDAAQPRRIIVFPTVQNSYQQVIPDAPTDGTWAMNEPFIELEAGLVVTLEPGDDQCQEFAILTYRPYHDGYPPGTYTVTTV